MNQFINRYGVALLSFLGMMIFATLTVGMATQWSFDVFQPQFLWKAYNYYFLSMLDGHLDVPVEAIGREGGFFNSKAYMYYGLLPAIVRAILYPFVDLSETPVSYFSVLFFTIIGHAALQVSLIVVYLKHKAKVKHLLNFWIFIGLSCLLWFGSASFLISQNATLYHEPYAVSLCLANIYLALLLKDGFFLDEKLRVSLIPYAVLAGLCIHARMPTALTLYLVTGILILVQAARIRRSAGMSFGPFPIILQSFRSFWPAITLLGAFGLTILWLNYAKYGDPLAFMGGNYGYFFLEGFSARRCNVIPQSEFQGVLRLIPNIIVYLSGSSDLHWSFTWHLATGFGRLEVPLIPLALLWPLPIGCFMYTLVTLIKGLKDNTNKIVLVSLLTFSVGAFFQLKYPTITHRYTAELWLPLIVCVLFLWFKFVCFHEPFTAGGTRARYAKYIFITVSFVVGIGYQLSLALTSYYYLDDGPIYNHHNYHYSEEDNLFLGALNPEKVKALKIEFAQLKAQKCDAHLIEKKL